MDFSSRFVTEKRCMDGSVLCRKIRGERGVGKSFKAKKLNQQNSSSFSFKMQFHIYVNYFPDPMNNHVCHFSDGHS